ncbi:replication protein A 32 kDa subunit-like protein [Leptotrombidium deliense]|uniref:Replication protein A 32 kDa subunit-like protein n=1 Tax=Leptotrombidium deliense TaxID=299467 RepID=A0A443RYD3_9ACAR|nr:replication protein A 32 kDa subunit-like protein [Leptotrombidium deliense]
MWDDSDMLDDSGAGFMKFDGDTAGPSESKPQSERTTRNLVAVNVDMLNKYYTLEHGVVIHDQKVSAITIVGQVESVSEQTTYSSFMLRDDCGPAIEVNFWTLQEKKETATAGPSVVENSMVRVYGQVRSKEGRVYISAFKVITIKDINEIAIHNLEVIYHFKMLERMKHNPIPIPSNAPEVDDREMISGAVSGLNKAHETLLNRITSVDTPEGISFEELVSCVHSMNERSIRETLEFLLREGHVYTTIDDDHYKATNM